jgi:hypothetical protein
VTAVTPTPGQVVYEAHQAFMVRRFPGIAPIGWDEFSGEAQGEWEAIAQAGIAAYTEANGNDLRERLEAAEAAKRQAKGELAALENRLAQAIAAALMAERARIRELADRSGAVCTGDEGTSHYFSALLTEGPR